MNKPIMLAIATLVILTASTFTLQTIQIAKAQYGGATGGNIEEQLKLAKAKITNSHGAGAYGSGVPMLGTNISETEDLHWYPGSNIWWCCGSLLYKEQKWCKGKSNCLKLPIFLF